MAELATFTLSQFQNSLKDLSLTNRFHAENQQHLQNQSRIAFLRAWEFGCHIRQQSFGLGPDAAEGWRELYSVSPHLIRIVSRSHPSELENQSRLRIISLPCLMPVATRRESLMAINYLSLWKLLVAQLKPRRNIEIYYVQREMFRRRASVRYLRYSPGSTTTTCLQWDHEAFASAPFEESLGQGTLPARRSPNSETLHSTSKTHSSRITQRLWTTSRISESQTISRD